MKYLFICVIGPVQDFIATARRSRDLWYGSWMLSELARAAAKAVLEQSGELIFPSDPINMSSVPNKIVATIMSDDGEFSSEFAEKVEKAVRGYLENTLAKPTLDELAKKSNTFNRKLAEAQIADLPEIYWVSVPYNNRNYDAVREEAEALLTARKTTRSFKQMTGANVPKSSLDGSREAVIDEAEYPNKDDSVTRKEEKVKKLYDSYHARQGERLSGVDLLKRLGGRADEPDFKSTSHMAAIPFMEKLGQQRTNDLVHKIRELFDITNRKVGKKDYGSLLYDSRLTDWIPAGDLQNELRVKFNETLNNAIGSSRPEAYYALLAADGDNMGKVINEQKDEPSHRKFSEALSGFVSEVKRIVERDNNGLLIYSGGDDVLAYLPINKALKCAKELEDTFRERLRKSSITATLSVGIVIAHHLDPLSDVLELVREAEHKAKDETKLPGKNGLAVTLSKRSGIDRTVRGKFSELYDRLRELKEFFDAGFISGGTAYELQELHRALEGIIPVAGLKAEAVRIVKHKKESGGGDLSQGVKDKFEEWIGRISLDELADEMIVAKAIADAGEEAKNTKEAQL